MSTVDTSAADEAGEPRPLRVVVVDDQAVVRGGLRLILETQPDIVVVGEAGDGRAGVELVAAEQPDVVLMDIRMPVLDGIAATAELVARDPAIRVLILTTYAADENVYDALRAGAAGFFAKTDEPDVLVAAVREVASEQVQLGPGVLRLVLDRFLAEPGRVLPPPPLLDQLTEREGEVLLLLGRGATNAEIADRLVIGEATVKTHVARTLAKLGLRDRTQAVVYCYEHGLLTPGDGRT
ncbi:MAG: response regulator transcription factor [Acidimicrobiales bacterium]